MDAWLHSGARKNLGRPSAFLTWALPVAAGRALLYFFDPAGQGFFPSCPFHALTGLYCPGCGSGRALHQLLHGNLAAAWGLNPLLMIALPVLFYFSAVRLWAAPGRRRPPGLNPSRRFYWAAFGMIAAFWILRNIPVYPFTLLAP